MSKLALLGILVAAVTSAFYIVDTARGQTTGTVTVVHGVPGLTVDVYVNGDLTLEGFAPTTVTDPLELPAGDYEIEIFAAGADPATDTPAISGSTTLPAGANASIVAHLTAAGDPTLSVFVNDVSPIAAGQSRLVVRHTAAAPTVDILVDGSPTFTGLANPNEAKADVPAGTYSAAVAATGTTDPVIGPATLTLEAGTAYFVYAIGSLEDQTLELVTQTITGLSAPAATPVPPAATPPPPTLAPVTGTGAGTGGDSSSTAYVIIALAALGGVLSLAGVRAIRKTRQ
jgi:hypothetical protein